MINKDFTRFGGAGDTVLSPLGLLLLLTAAVLILVLGRRHTVVPLLFAGFFIPLSERLVIGGIHLTAFRMLLVVVWTKVLLGSPRPSLRLTTIDRVFMLWALSAAATFIILWQNTDALVNKLGFLYDCLGTYFVLRMIVNTEAMIVRTVKVLAVICGVSGVCMLVEHFRGTNVFYLIGGVAESPEIRDGHIRAQGPFLHEILAGCFGGTLMPVFAGLWWQNRSRSWAILGMCGATAMTLASVSSTAMLAWAAGIGGLLMWPLRKWMRVLRWGIVLTVLALHLVMKAPVWALIARIDLAGGSSGYHRFELVNQTILHFWEWWLVGEKTTYQWGYNLWDTANTYVETAVTGGLITLSLFITIVVLCFKALGRTRKRAGNPGAARMSWTLGAALFANLVAFVGISYYDQTVIAWYLLLTMICCITSPPRRNQSLETPVRIEEGELLQSVAPADVLSD